MAIVLIVGFTMSYVRNQADLHNRWYSTGGLFVPGYGYGRFLKMITTNLPDWTDKSMNLYIESRYGANTGRRYDKEKEKKMRSCNRKYTESTMKTAAHHLHELQDLK